MGNDVKWQDIWGKNHMGWLYLTTQSFFFSDELLLSLFLPSQLWLLLIKRAATVNDQLLLYLYQTNVSVSTELWSVLEKTFFLSLTLCLRITGVRVITPVFNRCTKRSEKLVAFFFSQLPQSITVGANVLLCDQTEQRYWLWSSQCTLQYTCCTYVPCQINACWYLHVNASQPLLTHSLSVAFFFTSM